MFHPYATAAVGLQYKTQMLHSDSRSRQKLSSSVAIEKSCVPEGFSDTVPVLV